MKCYIKVIEGFVTQVMYTAKSIPDGFIEIPCDVEINIGDAYPPIDSETLEE